MRLILFSTSMVLLLSCGGITTRLCGAPGQPCCASSACDDGALCNAADLCEACGTEGQQCCASSTCAGALSCVSNACVQSLTCQVACTVGTSRCTNNGVETCTAAGVCPEWRATVAACPSGTVCTTTGTTADCQETCPGACTPDTVLCTNEGLARCVASGACPSLMTEADDTDVPACITGGVVSAELVWESPTPVGTTLVDIAGELKASYWVLDELGNIIRYALGPWEYELRATPGKRVKRIASCGQGSILFAAGENGTVYRRSAGAWTEENVGVAADLVDIACDNAGAFAVSSDGRFFKRTGSTWTVHETGVAGTFRAISTLFSQHQAYLVGDGGKVVRCDLVPATPVCTLDPTPVTANLFAVFGDTYTGGVWAAGDDGTLLLRGASWAKVPLAGVTDRIVGLTGLYDASLNATTVVGITEGGTAFIRRSAQVEEVVQVPDTGLTAPWVPDEDTLVFTGRNGALWYRNGLFSLAPFVARGGRKPTTASLHAVASAGQGRLFAVGENGARVRRQNGAWAVDQLGATTTASLHGVAVRSAGEVYAVGDLGTVLVRRWGTWVAEAEGLTTESLVGVALDTKHVWALGASKLLEKDLATGTWRVLEVPPGTPTLLSLALRKGAQGVATELVLAGVDCAALSFDPATQQFSPGPDCGPHKVDFLAAAFLASGDLLLASTEGTVHRRTGSTLAFENVMGLRVEPWRALVPDGSTMWAVGEGGALYRRVATNWSDAAPDVTALTLRAGVKDEDGLFIVGTGGVVLRRP